MAKREHLRILKEGVQLWNAWRAEYLYIQPDLSKAKLKDRDLCGTQHEPELGIPLARGIDFSGVNLSNADLRNADLQYANFTAANLSNANLSGAELHDANLIHANLHNADFTNTRMGYVNLSNNDLSTVKGLETVHHYGPSFISIDTLYMSKGKISNAFLQGCGIPAEFITYLPSLLGSQQTIEFYSCFISYSHKDQEFASRLYSRLRDANLRVWFAPENIKGGQKLHEQIDRAIQIHDRLLIVLSEDSVESEWVMTEIRNARKIEIGENRRKLFPIRLVDFDVIRKWRCFDAESGKDLAIEVREYFIPDFSNWKDHDAFEAAFKRLLYDLKLEESLGGRA